MVCVNLFVIQVKAGWPHLNGDFVSVSAVSSLGGCGHFRSLVTAVYRYMDSSGPFS